MNDVDDHFVGLERHHLKHYSLPTFNHFLNPDASTSHVIIHINGSNGDSIMENSNIGLQDPPPLSRKRKRSSANGDSVFKCRFCPKKFENESLLNSHIQDCQLTRTHSCELCGKRFKARGGLQQHNRIHLKDEDRPYTCSFCPRKFNQKSHLDQHERIHTGQKPFACQFCGRGFRQRSQQLGHEATHNTSNIINPNVGPSQVVVHQSHVIFNSTSNSFASSADRNNDELLCQTAIMDVVDQ